MYFYPFNFLEEAVTGTTDTFATLTGLTGMDSSGCPSPEFPIINEYIDPTQIFIYETPMLEKRIMTAHTLPKAWNLTYLITSTELVYLRTFFAARKGKYEPFYFVDPDLYTFTSPKPTVTNPPNLLNNTYVCTARFDNGYSAERFNKNWYNIEFRIVEVF